MKEGRKDGWKEGRKEARKGKKEGNEWMDKIKVQKYIKQMTNI